MTYDERPRCRAEDEIEAERQRQIDVERYTAQDDDRLTGGELYKAAGCYRDSALDRVVRRADGLPAGWPFAAHLWKPKNPVADLVRAGALALAEIDRLQRCGGDFHEAEALYEACVAALETPAYRLRPAHRAAD